MSEKIKRNHKKTELKIGNRISKKVITKKNSTEIQKRNNKVIRCCVKIKNRKGERDTVDLRESLQGFQLFFS
jgi:hypothetical protein